MNKLKEAIESGREDRGNLESRPNYLESLETSGVTSDKDGWPR